MKHEKSLLLSQFMLSIVKELEKKDSWTRNDVTNMLKNSAAHRATSTSEERAFLIKELALIEDTIRSSDMHI